MADQTPAARLADELDQLRGRLMRRDLGAQVVLIGMIERSRAAAAAWSKAMRKRSRR